MLILLIGEDENLDTNFPNEKSPLLEMREEINHVSNNEKRNVDDVIRRGRSLEMSQMPHHPEEEYCNPELVRKYLRKNTKTYRDLNPIRLIYTIIIYLCLEIYSPLHILQIYYF